MTENRKHYFTNENTLYHLKIYDLLNLLKKMYSLDTFGTVSISAKGLTLRFIDSLTIKVAVIAIAPQHKHPLHLKVTPQKSANVFFSLISPRG